MATRKKSNRKKNVQPKSKSPIINEIISAANELTIIEEKVRNNQLLTLEEMDKYGSFELISKDILDLEETLRPYKFKQLFLQYKDDLTFRGEYYKKNFNKKLSDYVSLETLQNLNKEKFNQSRHDSLVQYLRDKKVIIRIESTEVIKAKAYLESIANWWGNECASENHKDRELYSIAVETRNKEVLGLQKIKDYINGSNNVSTFKGLLKSYYSYLEAIILHRKIKTNNEPSNFEFNGNIVDYTLISIFHIMYRHYAQLVSPDLITKKSFFTPEIPPQNIHFLLDNLFKKIKQNKLFSSVIMANTNMTVFFRYEDVYYAVAFGTDSHNKSNIIVKSFFPLEEAHTEGKVILAKIKNTTFYQSNYLGDSLTVYTPK